MVNNFFLGKINNKEILFVTTNSYSKLSYGETKIYFLSSFQNIIKNNIETLKDNKIENIINRLQEIILDGLIILEKHSSVIIWSPYLDLRLSWFENDKNVVISDSAIEIAKILKLKLSKKRITSQFVFGLPFYPFQTISMWEEIDSIHPFCYLEISNKGCLEKEISFIEKNEYKNGELIEEIKQAFIDGLARAINSGNEVSCDVSGGVDSAAIAYTLNRMIAEFSLFHSESKKSSNSDTEWATHIANNLGRQLTKMKPIELTEKRFIVDEPYINGSIPSAPLLWADSEGYIKSVIDHLRARNTPVHVLGIGGDELFTPMPSNPWSIVRQERLLGFIYAIKYSLIMKRSFFSCLGDILNNRKYVEEVTQRIHGAFNSNTKVKNRELGWIDSLQIPSWLEKKNTIDLEGYLKSILFSESNSISEDRTEFQIIQSLIFQKSVLRQLQGVESNIHWGTPFLDTFLIRVCLSIPAKHKINSKITKPMLQKSMRGIVPNEIFSRGFKGDYSEALYSGYNKSIIKVVEKLDEFELVKMGIVDKEKLKIDFSLPTGNPNRIDFFERLCMMERWIRQVNLYIES